MHKAIISDVAKRDISKALRTSNQLHSAAARKRYRKLIAGAIKEIEKDFQKIGVEQWKPNVFRYHLRHSRAQSFIDGVRVKDPSHYLFFEMEGDKLRILRLLYETQEFHLRL